MFWSAEGFLSRLQFQEPMIAHGTLQEPKSSTLYHEYLLASSFQGHEVFNRKGNFPLTAVSVCRVNPVTMTIIPSLEGSGTSYLGRGFEISTRFPFA